MGSPCLPKAGGGIVGHKAISAVQINIEQHMHAAR